MQHSIQRLLTSTCALLLTAHAAVAQVDRLRVDSEAKTQIRTQNLVGVAIGIIENGEVAYVAGYGFEDREKNIPVTTETMFRWASISKPLTAIAAAQLAEQGQLDLDADIRNLVPEFPDKGTTITMRQLLGHLGGIVHYRNGPVIRTERTYKETHPYDSVILALDTFKKSPLVAKPGTEFNYSTHGFILASAVVERAGDAPFHEQVDTRIADPNGLDSLQPDYQWKSIPHRATGYREGRGVPSHSVVQSTDTDVSWKLGGGGFISTIVDLAEFAAALCDEQLITPAMRKELWTSQKTDGGKTTGYGLGFRVRTVQGELVVSHSGAQEKVRGYLQVRPEKGSGIVVLTNSEYGKPQEIADAVLEALNETPVSQ